MKEAYESFWKRMGAKTPADYNLLQALYSLPYRHHHTLENHIFPTLQEFGNVERLVESPDAIRMAIWWHDVVYDARARDNEERSANLAYDICISGGLKDAAKVKNLVLSTKEHKLGDLDAMILSDCDYSILGQPEEIFDRYNENINLEFSWLKTSPESWSNYVAKRKEFLESLKSGVFLTPFFIEKYESQARLNIDRALKKFEAKNPEMMPGSNTAASNILYTK